MDSSVMVKNEDFEFTASIRAKRNNFEKILFDFREKVAMPLAAKIIFLNRKLRVLLGSDIVQSENAIQINFN
jgi:hypothetical protein